MKKIKLNIFSMEASSKEPIGPTLGQYGVPTDKFCTQFNDATKIFKEKILLRVTIYVMADKSFTFKINRPTVTKLLNSILQYKLNDEQTIDLFQQKRKAGFFIENDEYIPSMNKNLIYTLVFFLKENEIYNENISIGLNDKKFSFFKKIIGICNSCGIVVKTN